MRYLSDEMKRLGMEPVMGSSRWVFAGSMMGSFLRRLVSCSSKRQYIS